MRKFVIAFFVLAVMFGGMSATAYAKNCFEKDHTWMNKTGDWFATLGKNPKEKERILVKRRHDRIAACAKKVLESGPRGKMGQITPGNGKRVTGNGERQAKKRENG